MILNIERVLLACVSANPTRIESPGSVPAVERALDILELLSQSPEGVTLSDLSKRLDFPKNAVFRITQTLLARGYLTRIPESMEFLLTPKLLRMAPTRLEGLNLSAVSKEAMTHLRDQTRETVQLGVLNGLEGTIIDQVEGLEPLRIVVNLGLRFPLHNNAPGKLLLAYLPEESRESVVAQIDLVQSTPRTITTESALMMECEHIVSEGYSIDHAEADEGIHCVAAPIFCARKESVVGTLWISGPAKRIPPTKFRELGLLTKEAGQRISRNISAVS